MLSIIQDSNLKEFIDAVLVLKTPYIATINDYICGFTDELGYIRKIKNPIGNMPPNIISSSIFKESITSIEFIKENYPDKGLNITIGDQKMYVPSIRPPMLYGVGWMNFYKRISCLIYPEHRPHINILHYDDIKPLLDSYLVEKKASDGAFSINLDNKILWIYKGLIPYNKPDKVSCTIYDNGNLFIADFHIIKKKSIAINVAMMFNKL